MEILSKTHHSCRPLVVMLVLLSAASLYKCTKFRNCDNPNLPVIMNFTFPDPLKVHVGTPIHVMAGAIVKETFPMRFKVRHKIERRFLGRWWTFPCVGAQGRNCLIDMPCHQFIRIGFNGTCPIKPGVYKNYNLTIPVPAFHVPWWLTEGLYRMSIEAYDFNMKKLWFCGNLTQYIEPADNYKKFVVP